MGLLAFLSTSPFVTPAGMVGYLFQRIQGTLHPPRCYTGIMPTSTPKRRWYQYSLRALLVFVVLCAVACSWFATRLRRAHRQREALAAIQRLGLRTEVVTEAVQRIRAAKQGINTALSALQEKDDSVSLELAELSRRVYPFVKRLLAIERERMPGRLT